MIWRKRKAGGVVLLLLCLGASYGTASAHGGPGRSNNAYPPVRGLVTGVNNSTIQVQAATGSVRIGFGTGTRVTHVVNGSTADLAAGQSVELQLATGTSTVKAIVIEARHGQPNKPSSGSGSHNRGDTRSAAIVEPLNALSSGRTAKNTGTTRATSIRNGVIEGQVLSATSHSITIRTDRGQSVAFSLSSNVAVTKLVAGHLSDLAIGETVQVVRSRGGSAVEITILSS